MFSDAQAKLETKPLETGNRTLDMVRKLQHIDLLIKALIDFIAYPLESNARTIYARQTKQQYDKISAELKETLTAAIKQGNAAARIIEQYGYFRVVAKHSGKCLDVPDENTANSVQIIQYDQKESFNQQWHLVADEDEYYNVVARHSSKCLDVSDRNTENHAAIIQYDCNGADNQKWGFLPDGNGCFTIVSKLSGKCLDVESGAYENGAPIIQFERTEGDNQKWWLKAARA